MYQVQKVIKVSPKGTLGVSDFDDSSRIEEKGHRPHRESRSVNPRTRFRAILPTMPTGLLSKDQLADHNSRSRSPMRNLKERANFSRKNHLGRDGGPQGSVDDEYKARDTAATIRGLKLNIHKNNWSPMRQLEKRRFYNP